MRDIVNSTHLSISPYTHWGWLEKTHLWSYRITVDLSQTYLLNQPAHFYLKAQPPRPHQPKYIPTNRNLFIAVSYHKSYETLFFWNVFIFLSNKEKLKSKELSSFPFHDDGATAVWIRKCQQKKMGSLINFKFGVFNLKEHLRNDSDCKN